MRYEDGYWHKLVLRELKQMIMHKGLGTSPLFMPGLPVKYRYSSKDARQEYEALVYLEHMGVIRTDLGGIDEDEPWLHGVDIDKLEKELARFDLRDVGTSLVELHPLPAIASVESRFGAFTAHKDGSVRFNERLIGLKPQSQRLLHRLITQGGASLTRDQIIDAIWDPDDGENYLDSPDLRPAAITKRIGNIVSETNVALRALDNKKHIISLGDTTYRLAV